MNLDEHETRRLVVERRRRIEAYQMAAEPIIKGMVNLRSMFTNYTITFPRYTTVALSDVVISNAEMKTELPPNAQRLYSAYEKALEQLQAMYLGEVPYP